MPPDPAPDPAAPGVGGDQRPVSGRPDQASVTAVEVMRLRPAWAVVLAGGSGHRMGTVDKPALLLGGRTMLEIALAAVAPARTVVVGPPRKLAADVLQTREDPPGGGPAAAVAAGVELLTALGGSEAPRPSMAPQPGFPGELVAVLAADLPGIDTGSVDLLTAAVRSGQLSGAVLLDPTGASQYLAGVWRLADLAARCRSRPSWHGGRLSDLLTPLIGARLPVNRRRSADLDTTADLLEWGVEPPSR